MVSLTVICLDCGNPLDLSRPDEAVCAGCGRRYPMTFGIPDLRGPLAVVDPVEAALTERLLALYPQSDFAALVDARLRYDSHFGDVRGHEAGYLLSLAERGRGMIAMFHARAAEFFPPAESGAALDIGCGSGASLLTLAGRYRTIAGLDPSLPDLILARKALETAGVADFSLVQAYGQRIPFGSETFDFVNALNVLEHVFDPEPVLSEIRRTLKPGGIFAADSRNRYDLFLPEPHVKIRWVGFVPRRWQKRFVRWRAGVSYETTRLLSYADLRRALRSAFERDYRIAFPLVNAYGGPEWVNGWLRWLERLPILPTLALWFFPAHLALARRSK